MKLTAIVHEENAGYWAEIPALPGCVTQADTLTELERNLKEAAELWIETAKK
ncbi:MAG: type II toxin-antitoxin system HicB family antitoxin [Candidatus Glassbacteria bacterium]